MSRYYHGYIDRTEAEKRLRDDGTPNSYLLRLGRIVHNDAKWESIYVLSYLSSSSECYHFKLIPRLNCFQLGGRLFDCLQGCLSRYYVQDIMTGERLRHPVAPCSPPLEYHTQRLRAIQTFEPENSHDRLGCTVGDRFLLVHEDPKTDWLLVTSLKSRHSGYLPKCCVEKEYPELIERLEFFHADALTSHPKELLKKAGAYSYLLRPCDSLPGLYTLLLYDGVRVRKYRLQLIVQSEPVTTEPSEPIISEKSPQRESIEPSFSIVSSVKTPVTNGDSHVPSGQCCCSGDSSPPLSRAPETLPLTSSAVMQPSKTVTVSLGNDDVSSCHRRYRTTTKVLYNGSLYDSVEQVVADIETHPGPWRADAMVTGQSNETAAEGDVIATQPTSSSISLVTATEMGAEERRCALGDTNSAIGQTSAKSAPVVFRPVHRERKSHPTPPSSAIYMALRSARSTASQSAALEIHGKLSMLSHQRKKWKVFYAQIDRKQGILTLKDGEKRKTEHYDLSKCDYFPVHRTMFDHHYCFGVLLHGASPGDRDELIFSVEAPHSSSAAFSTGIGLTGSTTSGTRASSFQSSCDLDYSTFAGRPEDSPSTAPPVTKQGHKRLGFEWPTAALGSTNQTTSGAGATGDSGSPSVSSAVSVDTVFARWVRCVRLHCRNTKVDAANEEDVARRQTHLRCYRTLEIKINGAKLCPSTQGKSKREEPSYLVILDGIEIARAYMGTSQAIITFDEFPFGFKKVEILNREENKRKRAVTVELELCQSNADLATSSNPNLARLSTDDLDSSGELSMCQPRHGPSTICAVRDRSSAQATISYKELHVLPFCHYDHFRHVLRSCLDTELAPLCSHVWKNLPTDVSKSNFVSSLLLVTTELQCHLQLIVNLLKSDITTEQPNNSFRGNSLGSQMLDMYSNSVCSAWRNQCFKRVREEAFNGPGVSNFCTSLSNLSQPQTGVSCPPTSRATVSVSGAGGGSGSVSGIGGSISAGGSGQRLIGLNGTTRPYSLSTGARIVTGVVGSSTDSPASVANSTTGTASVNSTSLEQEWHCRLIGIAVEDLISHVPLFPLQVRWVYSKIQAFHEDDQYNTVVCNLVFLRGLCPSLSSLPHSTRPCPSGGSHNCGSIIPGPVCISGSFDNAGSGSIAGVGVGGGSPWTSHSSSSSSACSPGSSSPVPSAAASALKLVAKTLLALANVNGATKVHPDSPLIAEKFMDYRTRLLEEFCMALTSPLQQSEVVQLNQLYESESFRASCRSLSRELATLASHFLEVLDHQNHPQPQRPSACSISASTESGVSAHEFRLWEYSSPPPCPLIFAALRELEDRTRQLIHGPRSLCTLQK
ncbi:Ras GTPase-activating protein 1 [Fasciola gigantica]|uniref:Ras GTPase-activating protein 1 n=1 Tax=Fasciola gigantica TaxID=46835 RepID=A0A504YZE9_FASGI|nr:Ras GTPase-activating protein 1 [Fasciola gigantica]